MNLPCCQGVAVKKRIRLIGVTGLTVLVGSLLAVLLWLRWNSEMTDDGRPYSEAIIGKWVSEDTKENDLTLTFFRSGEVQFSRTFKPWPGELVTGSGTWKVKYTTLQLAMTTTDSPWVPPHELQWEITIAGDRLTYRKGSYTHTLVREESAPRQTFDSPTPLSFAGSSDELQRTVVVPHLEAPLPKGKSAIWCGTASLTWKGLEDVIGHGPLVLEGAEDISRMMSRSPQIELMQEHYYLAAGFYEDGIADRIRREFPARFPKANLPDLPAGPREGALAFAYLEAAIRYEFEFRDSTKPLSFTDSQGQVTPVKAFGIRPADEDEGKNSFRGQVKVLFREGDEFALNLSRNTRPYQVVLARMSRKATLQATLTNLEERIAAAAGKHLDPSLGDGAVLLVPNMHWRIEHHFRELEGRKVRNPGVPSGTVLDRSWQFIALKMDRRGTEIVSGALHGMWFDGAQPEDFRFDRPYLIVLKKRDGRHPFFVMWVDNAELLQPW
jgi:hypothetical protein